MSTTHDILDERNSSLDDTSRATQVEICREPVTGTQTCWLVCMVQVRREHDNMWHKTRRLGELAHQHATLLHLTLMTRDEGPSLKNIPSRFQTASTHNCHPPSFRPTQGSPQECSANSVTGSRSDSSICWDSSTSATSASRPYSSSARLAPQYQMPLATRAIWFAVTRVPTSCEPGVVPKSDFAFAKRSCEQGSPAQGRRINDHILE